MTAHDPHEAELALLSIAMSTPSAVAGLDFDPASFFRPQYETLWHAFADLHGLGIEPDVATVLGHVNMPSHIAQGLAEVMIELVVYPALASNAARYAAQITEQAERRRLLSVLAGVKQRLDADELPLEYALEAAKALTMETPKKDDDFEHLLEVEEFIDRPDEGSADWVIPDLLTRGDRLVLTGVEGAGKAILMRQIGMCAAAGLDPFTLRRIPPMRVLLIDYENPEKIVKDTLRTLRKVLIARGASLGTSNDRRMWIRLFPQGVDLAEVADKQQLETVVNLIQPDLLLIGPAYKMYIGKSGNTDEDLARTVASELDRLREKYGFALILEHHSPHGNGGNDRTVRPFGSSLWMRWPEFGYGIRPEADSEVVDRRMVMKSWRGPRAERRWPERLIGGGPDELMWVDPDRMKYWDVYRSAGTRGAPDDR